MSKDLSIADQSMLWGNSLLRTEEGNLIFVSDIIAPYTASVIKEGSDKPEILDIPHDEYLQPIQERLGYVNYKGHALYWERLPRRQYSLGITANNSVFKQSNLDVAVLGKVISSQILSTWESISKCLDNIYPSLEEAIKTCPVRGGASVAFDKQFAIKSDRSIFYKGKLVGELPVRESTIEAIVWHEGHDYLFSLLSYEYLIRRENAVS